MHNLLKFWNKGRRSIIIIGIAIVLLIVLIQLLNTWTKNNKETKIEIDLTEDEKNLPTSSLLGDQEVSLQATKTNVDLINEFVDRCNTGKITEAYAMLTDDCKNTLYPTVESFQKNYYNRVFTKKRTINIENFVNDNIRFTYLVKFYEDAMTTGSINTDQLKQDYITIDFNSGEGKLSVNSLIKVEAINKYSTYKNVKITVVSKEIYKDYQKYQVVVENGTDNRIAVNTTQGQKGVYAIGTNGVSYNSNILDLSSTLLEIGARGTRNYTLKFNILYSANVDVKQIVFGNIVPDVETYKSTKDANKERMKISINV